EAKGDEEEARREVFRTADRNSHAHVLPFERAGLRRWRRSRPDFSKSTHEVPTHDALNCTCWNTLLQKGIGQAPIEARRVHLSRIALLQSIAESARELSRRS